MSENSSHVNGCFYQILIVKVQFFFIAIGLLPCFDIEHYVGLVESVLAVLFTCVIHTGGYDSRKRLDIRLLLPLLLLLLPQQARLVGQVIGCS